MSGPFSAPEDFGSHQASWRNALVGMRDAAPGPREDENERGYWQHELDVFDRVHAELAAEAPEMPHDLGSHREAWRGALTGMRDAVEDDGDRLYWEHELRAFDCAYAELGMGDGPDETAAPRPA